MSSAVAFLRGINVGGRAKVPMADLRTVATDLGWHEVRTYLQSGNVVFARPAAGISGVAEGLEAAIKDAFGFDARVIVRTQAELASVASRNPFLSDEADLKKLHVMFLDREPEAARITDLDPDRSPPDRFEVVGREIFLHYPNGMGRSKLTLDYFERRLGVAGTARNWNTVTKLLAMMEE